jgi:hypothetical protein
MEAGIDGDVRSSSLKPEGVDFWVYAMDRRQASQVRLITYGGVLCYAMLAGAKSKCGGL